MIIQTYNNYSFNKYASPNIAKKQAPSFSGNFVQRLTHMNIGMQPAGFIGHVELKNATKGENVFVKVFKDFDCNLERYYFKDDLGDEFDLIINNPPYIPTGDIQNLTTEVKDYDPMSALDGGKDGLSHYRQIASVAKKWLKTGGYIVLEVGINQAEEVADIFVKQGWKKIGIRLDLAQIKRCVILQK